MRSLRFKILAVAAALVLLSQAGTVMTVLVTAKRDVADRARIRLESGGRIFAQTAATRADQLGNTVSALAADYAFRQAVATRDIDTIASALANHAGRAGARLAYLLDADGTIIASAEGSTPSLAAEPGLVESAGENGRARSVTLRDGLAFEMITVPVRAPLAIGWVSMGFPLDDVYVQRIGELTGLNASLIASDGDDAAVVASSMRAPARSALGGVLASVRPAEPATLNIAGSDHLILAQPFLAGRANLTVVLTESLADAMAPYRLLQTAAILLGAVPLLLALAGAVLLSRALTRPVQQLAEAARRMKIGDYSRPVSIASGDELGELAVTFNAMQEDIASREQRIIHQARHDSLTGLPNRDFALKHLDGAIAEAHGASVAVLVINLNGCAEIAASLGHDITDQYVRQAAELLRIQIERQFLLARLETDSFLVILPGMDATGAADVAERLLQRLEHGVGLPDLTVSVRPTAGISAYPEHGESHDQLLLRATIAQANAGAGAPVGLYHGGEEQRRLRRLTILGDLRRAVRQNELQLYYQPKIAVADGRVCGAEALMRWEHPSLGRLSPVEFIPIAEQSGNISMLTRWALDAAVRDCRSWLAAGLDMAVSVNLAAADLADRDLPWFVTDVLRRHGLAPRYLIAEVTEEGLVRDLEHATAVLQRLREIGVRISIDDFGTGYSSLGQIRNLPVDELKIDRSFVRNLPADRTDAAIVAAAIDLAHDLGMEFVAEGVEDSGALDWLREHGCERAQGFHISPPLPAAEFVAWVRHHGARAAPAERRAG